MPDDHPLRPAITRIQSSGTKAAAIVQDLLTLARRGLTVSEVVDLRQLVREYLASPEMARLRVLHPNARISEQLSPDTGFIEGSPSHIGKCIMNLVVNALEAMPQGGTVTIRTINVYIDTALRGYDDVNEGEYVRLTVADTGVGIAEAHLERIFEPFFTKKRMGRSGTGLGMAVVWGSVKDHGGYIDVDSTEGEGTSISLYFPLSRGVLPTSPDPRTLDSLGGQGETILVVDDVAEQRFIAVTILKRLGYNAEAAESGEQALEFLKTRQVDLLVLDMIMPPGMDGLETYRRAVEFQPGIGAVIASGYSETDRVREAQTLGAGVYVRKPYTIERLGEAVRDELRKNASRLSSEV
jgi:CheY-like chemotaxis protein